MASPHLEVGYIARAHGLDGEVGVKLFDPVSEVLFDVERVLLRGKDKSEREVRIESVRPTAKDLLVLLEGVEGRTGAESVCGSTVLVFREDLEPPAEGEYFLGDLVGLTAVDESGAELGTVAEVWETGPVPNLVIRRPDFELLLPFADDFVVTVDLAARRVVIKPPEYYE